MRTQPMQNPADQGMADMLKSWTMVVLTFVFVLLYGTALFGWLKPLSDVTMITRLEPIIFVIIGYYFGRLPAQQNERTLKDEIGRQTQKADAAQQAKEQALQTREALEEKVKNARVALAVAAPAVVGGVGEAFDKTSSPVSGGAPNGSVAAAINILSS